MASATGAPATNGTSSAPSAGVRFPPNLFATLVKAENQHSIDTGAYRFVYEVKREAGGDFPGPNIFWQVDVPYITSIPNLPTRYTFAVVIDVNPALSDEGWTLLPLTPTPARSEDARAALINFLESLSAFNVLHVEQGDSKPGFPLVTRVTIQLDGVLWQVETRGIRLPIAPGVSSIKKITKFVRDAKAFPHELTPSDAAADLSVAVAECAIENAVNESKSNGASATGAPATNGTSSAPSTGPKLPPTLFATLVKAENKHGVDTGVNRFVYEVKREAGGDVPGANIFWQVDVPYIVVGPKQPPRYTFDVVIDVNPAVSDNGWALLPLSPTPAGADGARAALIQFLESLSAFNVLHVEQGDSKIGLPLATRVTIQLDGVLWQVVTEGLLLPQAPGVSSIKKITKFERDAKAFPHELKPSDAAAVLPVAVAECAVEKAVNESKAHASA